MNPYRPVKRGLDIAISSTAIVISSPLWVITIIGIEASDPGPVFYMANRIGKDDREFKMFKFRSMRVPKNEQESSEASLRPDEERIFPWGKVIRKLKIDEIPQFLNVLIGDMSIVGPRPVAKDQFQLFRTGKYDKVKRVKPGITGPAALFDYIYGDKFEEVDSDEYMKKVFPIRRELELVYLKKESLKFDTWVFFQTAGCVVDSLFGKENKKLLKKLIGIAKGD